MQAPPAIAVPFNWPDRTIGALDGSTAGTIVGAAADVAVVIDRDGIIQDVAFGSGEMANAGLGDWVSRPWIETVSDESRVKVRDMLAGVADGTAPRWRQVNHPVDGGEVPVRYLAVHVGVAGGTVAVGRDMRAAAALQQRLLQTQQAMERDYTRLRQAEQRYRMLFDQSAEAVVVIEAARRRIVEINPAAERLIGHPAQALIGQPFGEMLDPGERDAAVALFGSVAAAEQIVPARVRLAGGGVEVALVASLFRQDRTSYLLARMTPVEHAMASVGTPDQHLLDMLERMPDAFVVVDDALEIVAENSAFLDLTQIARTEELRGLPLARFLGRPGVDLALMIGQLREHGSIRNFGTISRGRHRDDEEVEVSAVSVPHGDRSLFGFVIRAVARRLRTEPVVRDLPRSVEQLTELVGRVSLKEIVRESTDLIERLCIEAALAYTGDNRASAAEVLGLSRQSLYAKLHRHGLGNLVALPDPV